MIREDVAAAEFAPLPITIGGFVVGADVFFALGDFQGAWLP